MTEERREEESSGSFFQRYGPFMFLGALAIYMLLLIIGVVAEVFKIQSILDWWIWRPVGR